MCVDVFGGAAVCRGFTVHMYHKSQTNMRMFTFNHRRFICVVDWCDITKLVYCGRMDCNMGVILTRGGGILAVVWGVINSVWGLPVHV